MIQKLRDLRNKLFGHNTSMEVPDHKVTKVFNILGVLFRHPNIINHIDSADCLKKLKQIENNDTIECSLERIETELKQIQENENVKFDEILDTVRLNENPMRQQTPKFRFAHITILFVSVMVICLLLVFGLVLYMTNFSLFGHQQPNHTIVFSKRHKRKYSNLKLLV